MFTYSKDSVVNRNTVFVVLMMVLATGASRVVAQLPDVGAGSLLWLHLDATQLGLSSDAVLQSVQPVVGNTFNGEVGYVHSGPNAMPTLSFDGIDDSLLAHQNFGHSNVTAFFAMHQREYQSVHGIFSLAKDNDYDYWREDGLAYTTYENTATDTLTRWTHSPLSSPNNLSLPASNLTIDRWHLSTIQLDSGTARIITDSAVSGSDGYANTNPIDSNRVYLSQRGEGLGTHPPLYGSQDMAEVIVFSQALAEAPRRIIENYLSAKYDIAMATGMDLYAGDTSANGDHDRDVFGLGHAGGVVASSTQAGLTLAALNGSLDPGEFLMAGHKTPTGEWLPLDFSDMQQATVWSRSFYLDATGLIDASLSFDIAATGFDDDDNFGLLYQANPGDAPALLSSMASVDDGRVTFELDALDDGLYALGVLNPVPTPMAAVAGVILFTALKLKRHPHATTHAA